MQTLWQDLRYGARMLWKKPGFTLIAVLTLALGIGANTAIFSVVNAVLLRPLPYPHAERMVYVFEGKQSDPKAEDSISPHNFTDLRSRNQSFDSYFALNHVSFTLTDDQQPEALSGVLASADFGRVVGMAPALGRVFTAEEDAPGKDHVALISDGLWRRRFGANPQITGQNVHLNGEPYTVIGVMPPNFNFPNTSTEVWAPLGLDLAKYGRRSAFLIGVARLKPDVTVEQARADLQNIAEQLKKEIPNFDPNFTLKVEPVREHLFGDLERPLMILLGAVALVLLIACVNVANLMLGRATARWKELALRSALGASRWSLVRLLLTESVLMAVVGGAVGLLLASYGVDALMAINPAAIPSREKVTIDGPVIAFTFLMSLLTGALFGLAPAWQAAKTDLSRALGESSRSATGARRLKLMRSGLVVAEISLSLVLLVSAGLLIESLWKLIENNHRTNKENAMRIGIWLAVTLILFCHGVSPVTAQAKKIKRLDGSTITIAEIEREVQRLMKAARVTGLGVAILNNNQIAYINSFGWRNKEAQQPLSENTVMYGASFTKSVFAYLVMQLAAEVILDLDKPIAEYLPKPLPDYEKYKDLAGDERWKMLTLRMLLSHTTGFPNFRFFQPDGKLNFNFTPGTRYAYSGEGINLAQFVIEIFTNKEVGALMRDRIFKPLGMVNTSMTWQEHFQNDLALGHDEQEKPLGHNKRGSVRAAGSMDTTINDFARFVAAVMQGQGLTPRAKAEMLRPQIRIHSKAQFPTLNNETTDENRAIRLAYGLGWGLFETPYGKAYFKEGHDDGWENHCVVFGEKKLALVLMANSSNGDSIFKELLATLLKDTYTPWKWEGYIPYNQSQ
ncbi:MAG: serine hydrolase [Blastocatellia bacterium]